MPASINQLVRGPLTAVLAAAALLAPAAAQAAPVANPSAPAPAVDPDLCAISGTVDLPGAPATPVWSFAEKPAAGTCADATAQIPGPPIEVATGSSVVLNFTNTLDKPLEITAPGLSLDPGPTVVPAGNSIPVPITFTAPSTPGTYLYSSVGDAGRQQAMGLYGALVVCASPPCSGAGSEHGTAYDRATTLVLSEIDTAFANDPDGTAGFSMNDWHPNYWLINGKTQPDIPEIATAAGEHVLLRYLSAGPENVTMTMLGTHGTVVARDAFALADPIEVVAETIPAGATADVVAAVPAGTPPGTRLPLYNRQLNLGMMTFLSVP